jgi:hypothetical protein
VEYHEIRNKIYKELRLSKTANTLKKEDRVEVDFSSYYILMLVLPEETECFETVHILNYFGFQYNLEEDNILK